MRKVVFLTFADLDIRVSLKGKNWAESAEKPKVTFVTCPKKFPSRSMCSAFVNFGIDNFYRPDVGVADVVDIGPTTRNYLHF